MRAAFIGAVAVRPAVEPLLAAFEAETGVAVARRWELNPAVKAAIVDGARFDVVVTNPHLIAELTALGLVAAGTQVPFGRVPMGLAVKAGAVAPPFDSVEQFVAALRRAGSIAYASEGSSGAFFLGLLEQLGQSAELAERLMPVAGAQTASSVARGEAELAVVPITSILAAGPDVQLAGRFPAELGGHIDFDIARSAENRNVGRELAACLLSPRHDAALARAGLDRRRG